LEFKIRNENQNCSGQEIVKSPVNKMRKDDWKQKEKKYTYLKRPGSVA
jgi:hypothetical protein